MVNFMAEFLDMQLGTFEQAMGILEHPEDLGAVIGKGVPGSIWRWKVVKDLLKHPGTATGAFYQSDRGRPFAKPRD